jgi:hypothetical protein
MPHCNQKYGENVKIRCPIYLVMQSICCSSYDDIFGVYECPWSAIKAMEDEIERQLSIPDNICKDHVRDEFWIEEGDFCQFKPIERDSYLNWKKDYDKYYG